MGPLTYKVFNLYFSIRCGTYKSHLHTTLPLKCESINSSCSPLKRKLFHPHTLILILVPPLSPHTTEPAARTPLVRRTFDTRSQSNPSSNHDSDTTVGSRGEPGGPSTSRPEIGTINLEFLHILFLILFGFFNFLFL